MSDLPLIPPSNNLSASPACPALNATALLLPVVMLILSACNTLPVAEPEALSWQQHQAAVLETRNWLVQGRLNIRQGNESSTISLLWEQDADAFEINLSATLGLGAVTISGNSETVVIEKSGEEPLAADSLEAISADYLGYEFPAEALYYWIRGVPAPDSGNRITLNRNQRLASLNQEQWQLEYDRYQQASGLSLPGRIRMTHGDYRLTFLISRWEPG